MIIPERFIARSSSREAWLYARSMGVTATQVAKGSTPAGMKEVIAQIKEPTDITPNAMMEWGTFREPFIADIVKERFGIMPNEWLIAKDDSTSRWQMATPDGLSLNHSLIAEIKTTGKSLDSIPLAYKRQMQWQLYCTDAERCLFAYEERLQGPEGFVAGMDIHTQWVERDEQMIRELIATAQKVQMEAIYFEETRDA